ncbi:hypothetical protein [Paenibacillus rigui]|uniref:Uncharacterized protein n=1 Tax=Paenibacillus rigui TaxID=554312 RepID=A0A229URW2_9BACL|nr:hypothetical protein [Paenibacillus rigui]OXM86073.1 hypothetical protein CF651_12710 [Paenibacillus rigui]
MLANFKKTRTGLIVATLCLSMLTAGCTDTAQLKQDMLQAAAKQEQVTSYRFNGSLQLKADATLLGQSGPMALALFSLLKDSKLEYSGLTAMEPSRMESDLKVTPAGGTAIEIPVLIKDSKLFFHMPPLNKPDEYMMLPIAAAKSAASAGSSPAGPESLKNTGRVTSDLSKKLWEGVDPKWLTSPKETVQLSDGSPGKKITLNVNSKNEKAFNDYWSTAVPGLIDILKTNGLAGSANAEAWTNTLKQIKLKAPSAIDIVIDNQGFIREQRWDLTFTSGSSTNENKLLWTQSLTELNQAPSFTKETPAKQKSLEELLKLIKPAAAAQK